MMRFRGLEIQATDDNTDRDTQIQLGRSRLAIGICFHQSFGPGRTIFLHEWTNNTFGPIYRLDGRESDWRLSPFAPLLRRCEGACVTLHNSSTAQRCDKNSGVWRFASPPCPAVRCLQRGCWKEAREGHGWHRESSPGWGARPLHGLWRGKEPRWRQKAAAPASGKRGFWEGDGARERAPSRREPRGARTALQRGGAHSRAFREHRPAARAKRRGGLPDRDPSLTEL
ncbi:hypothetical protein NDU88_006329 [Pleurodeles waltl]|uniref:Uncharacterized protein n=1 Tax=Pleurodeles waltl TaxID=8319 RepID=A0AAV7SPA8_PLEWA|nr:hypothetical protein NDU88_006329 [Pleurodeles waltl]